jgi:hypothetical protein
MVGKMNYSVVDTIAEDMWIEIPGGPSDKS